MMRADFFTRARKQESMRNAFYLIKIRPRVPAIRPFPPRTWLQHPPLMAVPSMPAGEVTPHRRWYEPCRADFGHFATSGRAAFFDERSTGDDLKKETMPAKIRDRVPTIWPRLGGCQQICHAHYFRKRVSRTLLGQISGRRRPVGDLLFSTRVDRETASGMRPCR